MLIWMYRHASKQIKKRLMVIFFPFCCVIGTVSLLTRSLWSSTNHTADLASMCRRARCLMEQCRQCDLFLLQQVARTSAQFLLTNCKQAGKARGIVYAADYGTAILRKPRIARNCVWDTALKMI